MSTVEAQDLCRRHLLVPTRIDIHGHTHKGKIAAINLDAHHPHFVHVIFVSGEGQSMRKGLSLPLDWPVDVTL